jgi:hypothetical protein
MLILKIKKIILIYFKIKNTLRKKCFEWGK